MPGKSAVLKIEQAASRGSNASREVVRLPYTLIACINHSREILMVKRNRPPFVGLWNLIGGKIDIGERPTSAAIREISEEANIQASPSRVGFRGIAIWPNSGEAGVYVGMFLFHFQSKLKHAQTRQLGMLHEGVTAWIDLTKLLNPSEYVPVPNFELLASHMLDVNRPPAMICHEQYSGGARVLWTAPVSERTATNPYAGAPLLIGDLIGQD